MFKDITGQRFGQLIAVKKNGKDKRGEVLWECICDCGQKKIVQGGHLRSGHSKSCGCIWIGKIKKYGMGNTPFAAIFRAIKARCENPKNKCFDIYGSRGIKCLWKSFKEFKNDMYKSYKDHVKKFGRKRTQIDRIDTNGNYYKENCRWVTPTEQARNKRTNHFITFNNKTKSMAEWAEIVKIPYGTLQTRINRYKWPVEKAFTIPVKIK